MAISIYRVDIEHVKCGRARLDSVRLGQTPQDLDFSFISHCLGLQHPLG